MKYIIVVRWFDDTEQKDLGRQSKPQEDYKKVETEAQGRFNAIVAAPDDDRYGVTVLQEVTMNIFGKVTREWWACAWFGKNPKYLVQPPTQLEDAA
jgi:hypothetical protein